MTAAFSDEAELRQWLVDYLVTNIGSNPDEVDLDQSLADLGLGSPEAVVLSGELAELLGRPVSPVEFWQHPTINALVGFLTAPESESTADAFGPLGGLTTFVRQSNADGNNQISQDYARTAYAQATGWGDLLADWLALSVSA